MYSFEGLAGAIGPPAWGVGARLFGANHRTPFAAIIAPAAARVTIRPSVITTVRLRRCHAPRLSDIRVLLLVISAPCWRCFARSIVCRPAAERALIHSGALPEDTLVRAISYAFVQFEEVGVWARSRQGTQQE